ncbi:MAG: hypothetical protein KDD92_08595 [Caldilineaceae bacterium]|nr:hypothetical protein [Caldilineaceae bacterium]
MKNRVRFLIVLALVAVLAVAAVGSVMAQTKFSAYVSGIQVANLETSPATVTLAAYNSDGTKNGSDIVDTIPGSGSKTYFPLSNVSQGFSGSVIISSDKNVAAISNILSSDYSAGGSYVGRSSGATQVQMPLLNKNNSGFTTWYSVQNASTDPATVNVEYSDGTSAGPVTIQPGAASVFYQDNETHNSAVFSGIVTSDKPIVAAGIQESSDIIFSYTGFTGGAASPVFPLINANNSGYVTGLQIQNTGDQATDVEVTYTATVGTNCTETQTIPARGSNTFALAAFANGQNSDCAAGARFVGSAKVTGNSTGQLLVGIGNQLLPGTNGEAYVSFDADAATSTVVMPLIMDRNSGYFTGFNIQNVGDSRTTVTCEFTNTDYTVSGTIDPRAALNAIQNNEIADGYVGSGRCTASDSNAKIVAVVNQLGSAAGADQFLVYEGVNVE